MNWDIVLYTRNKKIDFDWFSKPDYIGKDIDELQSCMFDLKYKIPDGKDLIDDMKCTLFGHFCEEYCGIFRVMYLGTDHVGRSIPVFEGVVGRREFLRDFIIDIPNILMYFIDGDEIPSKIFDDRFDDFSVSIPDVINPFTYDEENLLDKEIPENIKDGLKGLIEFIASDGHVQDFLIGPVANDYKEYLGGICNNIIVYGESFAIERKEAFQKDKKFELLSVNPFFKGKVGITGRITRNENDELFFQWLVFPVSNDEGSVEPLYIFDKVKISENVEIGKLIKNLTYIDAYLYYLGWTRIDQDHFIYKRILSND